MCDVFFLTLNCVIGTNWQTCLDLVFFRINQHFCWVCFFYCHWFVWNFFSICDLSIWSEPMFEFSTELQSSSAEHHVHVLLVCVLVVAVKYFCHKLKHVTILKDIWTLVFLSGKLETCEFFFKHNTSVFAVQWPQAFPRRLMVFKCSPFFFHFYSSFQINYQSTSYSQICPNWHSTLCSQSCSWCSSRHPLLKQSDVNGHLS
jgi:hypothetical protein